MKMRRIITMGLVALVTAGAAFLFFSRNSAQKALKETRRALRQQGFKIDLAEFDLSASAELRARAAALTNAAPTNGAIRDARSARPNVFMQARLDLMPTVSSDAALVVWKQEKLSSRFSLDFGQGQTEAEGDFWPVLRQAFEENHTILDAACEAAMAGPIRFDLNVRHGGTMRLPHLAELKNLTQILGTRAVLELHDGHKDPAWTNLLASTRLISA